MAVEWYRKLDVHAPMVEVLPLIVDRGLEMRFPEATLRGHAGFEPWYQGVIRIFFDEVHVVKSVKSKIREDWAEVKVVVHWEASRWRAPAMSSDRISLDAYQTWVVVPHPVTGRPSIRIYKVDRLRYLAGSARL